MKAIRLLNRRWNFPGKKWEHITQRLSILTEKSILFTGVRQKTAHLCSAMHEARTDYTLMNIFMRPCTYRGKILKNQPMQTETQAVKTRELPKLMISSL